MTSNDSTQLIGVHDGLASHERPQTNTFSHIGQATSVPCKSSVTDQDVAGRSDDIKQCAQPDPPLNKQSRRSPLALATIPSSTMSSPLNSLLSGLHLSDEDAPGQVPRNNRQMATKDEDTVTSLIDEKIHSKNQLCVRDSQISNLAALLEALERRSSSPRRITTSPVSPRAPPQPPRQGCP